MQWRSAGDPSVVRAPAAAQRRRFHLISSCSSYESGTASGADPAPRRFRQHAEGLNGLKIVAEISVGEFVDKLTILEIKLEKISDASKRTNIAREYESLSATFAEAIGADAEVERLRRDLKAVNAELWRIEDEIRDRERTESFGAEFVALARAVYRTNDRRAEIKRAINMVTGSKLVEEKSYAPY